MVIRFLIAASIVLASAPSAQAAEVWRNAPLASDVEWEELSGASSKDKRPLTIKQIDQVQAGRRPTDRTTVWGTVDATSYVRNVECMKAFGHPRFCRCLGEALPVFLSFAEYVHIVTGAEAQVSYKGMKTDEKKRLIENTTKAREQCVATAFSK